MARVTVEDCVDKIPNRFELILIASQRARELAAGTKPTVERDNDKNPVVALREIAGGTVEFPRLREAIVRGMQKSSDGDEPDEEIAEVIRQEQLLADQAASLGQGDDLSAIDGEDSEEEEDEDLDAIPDQAVQPTEICNTLAYRHL